VITLADETKTTGKLYHGWMEVKATLTTKDRKSTLSSCEFGVDKAKQTYENVLKDTEDLSSNKIDILRK